MKHCLIQKLCGFKGGRIWRINFLWMFSRSSLFCFNFFHHKSKGNLIPSKKKKCRHIGPKANG